MNGGEEISDEQIQEIEDDIIDAAEEEGISEEDVEEVGDDALEEAEEEDAIDQELPTIEPNQEIVEDQVVDDVTVDIPTEAGKCNLSLQS